MQQLHVYKVEKMVRKEKIDWTVGLLTKTFKLSKVLENDPLLNDWLTVENNLSAREKAELERIRLPLLKNFNNWNAETLKMKFIALLLDLVNYDSISDFQTLFDAEVKALLTISNSNVLPILLWLKPSKI